MYRTVHSLVILGLSFLLAACDNSQTGGTQVLDEAARLSQLEAQLSTSSSFATPASNGRFALSLPSLFANSFSDSQGNGYAYELSGQDASFAAVAGLLTGTTVTALPAAGGAAMRGSWDLSEVGRSNADGREFGETSRHSGRITLNANFATGRLSGSEGEFSVDGRFTSTNLAGSVFFNGRSAELTGLIGGDKAVGAFHSANSDTALAGGFYVSR